MKFTIISFISYITAINTLEFGFQVMGQKTQCFFEYLGLNETFSIDLHASDPLFNLNIAKEYKNKMAFLQLYSKTKTVQQNYQYTSKDSETIRICLRNVALIPIQFNITYQLINDLIVDQQLPDIDIVQQSGIIDKLDAILVRIEKLNTYVQIITEQTIERAFSGDSIVSGVPGMLICLSFISLGCYVLMNILNEIHLRYKIRSSKKDQ